MTKTVSVSLTDDQYELARRRAFVEDLGWRTIFNALVNAYIAGDITVTAQGRYTVHPPKSATPIVHVRRDADVVEIEPDWNVNDPRPQVGDDPRQQARPHSGWGTRALTQHIAQETGRKISKQYLRRLLSVLGIEKAENGRWYFEGPQDSNVSLVLRAIEEGVYDQMIAEGVATMVKKVKAKESEIQDHVANHEAAKRARFAERLRQREE